ncbi:DNA-processing protein DprA [Moheibacter sediminis]|nr:DNA-processing protein DprA [Moheibacter sediminis]
MKPNLLHLLALTYIPGMGVANAKKILKVIDDPEIIWQMNEKELNRIFRNKKDFIPHILNQSPLRLAEKEIIFAEKHNIEMILNSSADYPQKLRQCSDAPLVLFKKGKHDFNKNLHIGIVGTRKMTHYGKTFIDNLISDLSTQNITIVSGLAYGCDIIAHQSAIKHDLPTIAVLAHGLNKIAPAAHKKDAESLQKNGALVSEYSTFHKPEPLNFILRNRIIAGLCDAVIVVESDVKGGSLATAMYANSYNREVFAVPGRIDDKYSLGCNHLIQNNQAYLIRNAEDLLNYFNLKLNPKPVQKELFIELNTDEEIIYNFLMKKGKQQIDQLATELEIPTFKLNGILLNLELKGIVKPLSGKFFEIK